MTTDEKHFFREATLRICESLEIEKALHQCLLYIREFIPAEQMNFHVYHRDQGVVETVARATSKSGEAMSVRSPLAEEGRRQVVKQRSIRVRIIDRLGDDPVTGPVAEKLNASDLSGVVMDLVLEKTMLGVLSVFCTPGKKFDPGHIRLLYLLNKPFAIALTNSLRYRELMKLRDLLADDNRYLQDELQRLTGEEVIGSDFGLKEVMEMVRRVAPLDSPVLLLGETGTGKEVIANAIHKSSLRKDGPLIKVNCGAIPETLMDSELFGYEKGAFTGALSRKRGRIERAHRGTLFLDEIGELPAEAQVRLLRVLQEKEIDRVGGTAPVKVDIRVIAATHRDLEGMADQKKFRADLYFRLGVFPILIPPLRERKTDIPALVQHFILKKSREMKRATVPSPAPNALDRLMAYHWPGNIRELENTVERSLILNPGDVLLFKEVSARVKSAFTMRNVHNHMKTEESMELDAVMSGHIRRVLDMCGGRVEGERGAARVLNIHPSTLRKRMKKLGIPFGRKTGKRISSTIIS
ncbi:sigma-54 interaction domain-containing protein [Desulfonema magnum]|uniref:Transcriptional regulator, sigma54-dependent n=1 Tax=Desulfonema magnum TaxID=45655 RepID=A0A975GNC3_9BACT|nr:sigma 54-interacting transcriptional regulator [Desulfonema magnum]QTA87612.1 Transcriptional regulator, sigma54-dependent [Desulfonema magnum]